MFTVLLAPSGFAFCLFRSGLFLQPLSVVLHLLFLCFTLLHPFANYHAIAKYLLAHTVTLSLSLTVSSTHPQISSHSLPHFRSFIAIQHHVRVSFSKKPIPSAAYPHCQQGLHKIRELGKILCFSFCFYYFLHSFDLVCVQIGNEKKKKLSEKENTTSPNKDE